MNSIYETLEKPDFLFDSHCHLNAPDYDSDLSVTLDEAKHNGIMQIFDIGVNYDSSLKSLSIAKKYKEVKSFVGIDPEVFTPGSEFFIGFDIKEEWFDEMYLTLSNLITENRKLISGIGETGMDHFHLFKNGADEETKAKSYALQERLYRLHLELAQKYKLPLTIHSRFAEQICLNIALEYEVTGIFHSFTGGFKTMKQLIGNGFGVGVNGIITYKSANDLRNIYKKLLSNIPKDIDPESLYKRGIFFETDGPFLPPEGKRGERNVPGNVRIVFEDFVNYITQ